tara:strand:+ start:1119 stop:1499 length:381 start_codon:yes stop_codon:yes gene_type:complete
LFTAQAATGESNAIFSRDFRNAVVSIDTTGSANMTIKFQGAIIGRDGEAAPDFGSAQSTTNRWDYIQVVDLQSGSQIDGDTGLVLSGTDDHRVLEFNTNHLDYVSVQVSAYSAGTLVADITLSNNE